MLSLIGARLGCDDLDAPGTNRHFDRQLIARAADRAFEREADGLGLGDLKRIEDDFVDAVLRDLDRLREDLLATAAV